jgi:hypothetical protein
MRKLMLAFTLVLNGIILFYACKKDKEEDEPEYDTQTSQDNSLAEGTFNDVNNIMVEAMENGSLTTYRLGTNNSSILSTCATVTNTPDSSGGGTIVVDFGNAYCHCSGLNCSDFRYRKGKINIAYTGHYRDSLTVITTTFDNYYVGYDTTWMYKVSGTKTVTNNGHNAAGHLNFTISVNGQLTTVDNSNMSWSSTRTREWIAGESTMLNWWDDEYLITGSANGTNFEGNSFTVNITSALHVVLSCANITEGIFELTPSGKATRTLDYGNGTCDNAATITVNGRQFNVTLR